MNTEQAYIDGFVKRAMEHGFTDNEAFALLKKAFGEEDGPYRQEQAAKMMAAEQVLKAIQHNKEKHKAHYLLNPFVSGPVREMAERLKRRFHAGAAGEHGGLVNLLGAPGVAANTILGNEEKRDARRKMFDEHSSGRSAEEFL
jgi:hypothetical protein